MAAAWVPIKTCPNFFSSFLSITIDSMSLRPLISNISTSTFWAQKRISWDQQHGESLQDFLPYLLGPTFHSMISPPQTAQMEGVDLWGKMGVMPHPGQERGHGHLVLVTLRLTQTALWPVKKRKAILTIWMDIIEGISFGPPWLFFLIQINHFVHQGWACLLPRAS